MRELEKTTLHKADVRKILRCSWPEANRIFDEIQSKYKRLLPGNRILTADFIKATGIKKEGC